MPNNLKSILSRRLASPESGGQNQGLARPESLSHICGRSMMTNVISYLYTTFAYQSAAMHLMVAQANFDAQQLHLRETLPITVPGTNDWNVAMPPDGVGGWFQTSNYVYRFNHGHLIAIQKKNRPHGAQVDADETQPSVINTNEAYQLARTWLAGVSVDMNALESKFTHRSEALNVRPAGSGPRGRLHSSTNDEPLPSRPADPRSSGITTPIYSVTWGGNRGRTVAPENRTRFQANVDILGSTKQCIGMHIFNPDILKAPPLEVTNAAELLGPLPQTQHFVEDLFGGKAAYAAVTHPDKVYAWLLGSPADDPNGNKTDRTPAVLVDSKTAALFSQTLTDFNSYSWLAEKDCLPDYGARLRFLKGPETVDISICYECDHLHLTSNGRTADKDCDGAHAALVRAMQAVFPADPVISKLNVIQGR